MALAEKPISAQLDSGLTREGWRQAPVARTSGGKFRGRTSSEKNFFFFVF